MILEDIKQYFEDIFSKMVDLLPSCLQKVTQSIIKLLIYDYILFVNCFKIIKNIKSKQKGALNLFVLLFLL